MCVPPASQDDRLAKAALFAKFCETMPAAVQVGVWGVGVGCLLVCVPSMYTKCNGAFTNLHHAHHNTAWPVQGCCRCGWARGGNPGRCIPPPDVLRPAPLLLTYGGAIAFLLLIPCGLLPWHLHLQRWRGPGGLALVRGLLHGLRAVAAGSSSGAGRGDHQALLAQAQAHVQVGGGGGAGRSPLWLRCDQCWFS